MTSVAGVSSGWVLATPTGCEPFVSEVSLALLVNHMPLPVHVRVMTHRLFYFLKRFVAQCGNVTGDAPTSGGKESVGAVLGVETLYLDY